MKTTLAFSLAAAVLVAGAPRMSAQAPAATAASPEAKAAGKLRIGVAPSEAQLGQGSTAQGDYGLNIRNSIVVLMNGPAVEIVPLDSHLAMQVQAEAQQKQCDFVLLSSVVVKHKEGSGFGKFLKHAAPVASMLPMAGMAGGMGGAMAGQAAASVMAMSAQEQAMNQLSSFNKQIKSKDDVTVGYELFPTGVATPRLQNQLNGKAKSDGEDVLTPLILQAANTILSEVTRK
jgi:hypothetical protein